MSEDDEIDELFTKPPSEFTAARNALAAKAKAAGRRDLAIRIGGLRKPTTNVWLVNQIARRNSKQIAALLEAANELREAQAGALRGEGGEALQAASQAWRAAVKDLVKRGRSITERFDDASVAATLFGASARPSHAKKLAEGTLVEEVEPPDFSSALGMSDAPPSSRAAATTPKRSAAPPREARGRDIDDERRRREDEKRREREEAARRRAHERELAEARREAKRAADEASRNQARADDLARRAKAADELATHALEAAEASKRRADDLERRMRELAASRR